VDEYDDDLWSEGGPGAAEPCLHRVVIDAALAGARLDRALSDALGAAGLSRSRLKSLLDQGCVTAGGLTIVDASLRVKPGQEFVVAVPAAETAEPVPQDIPLVVPYEDADLLVIDKPAGMVVHPAAGNADGTLVNALLAHCGDNLSGIGGVRRPGIVHRLDKDTSGLMVVAKNDRAHQGLSAQFADRSLSRTYRAVAWGTPQPREGEIEGNIGRHPTDRKRMAHLEEGGKPALTLYRVVKARGLTASLVECKLMTGRTHQIRVHMAECGWPLMGDPLYGKVRPARLKELEEPLRGLAARFPRQALHAAALVFRHPLTGRRMEFTSPLPDDMQNLIVQLGLL